MAKIIEVKEETPETMLSEEELENFAGGASCRDPGLLRESRFVFWEEDIEMMKKAGYPLLQPGVVYSRGTLNKLGIKGRTMGQVKEYLMKQFGLDCWQDTTSYRNEMWENYI